MSLRSIIAALVLSAGALACTEDPVEGLGGATDAGGVSTPRDAGPAADAAAPADAAPREDAGPADAGPPDTGAEDLGPPARRLVTRRIFGSLPAGNLVMNPLFDTQSALRPIRFDGEVPARIVTFRSPTGTPLVRLENGSEMVLFVQGAPGPLEASIWLGREEGASFEGARVALVGLGDQQLQTGGELTGDPMSDQRLEDRTWRRFSGTIQERILGQAFLLVEPPAGRTWAAGPVVVPTAMRVMAAEGARAPALGSETARALELDAETRAGLRRVLRAFAEESRRRLAPPRRPSISDLPHLGPQVRPR